MGRPCAIALLVLAKVCPLEASVCEADPSGLESCQTERGEVPSDDALSLFQLKTKLKSTSKELQHGTRGTVGDEAIGDTDSNIDSEIGGAQNIMDVERLVENARLMENAQGEIDEEAAEHAMGELDGETSAKYNPYSGMMDAVNAQRDVLAGFYTIQGKATLGQAQQKYLTYRTWSGRKNEWWPFLQSGANDAWLITTTPDNTFVSGRNEYYIWHRPSRKYLAVYTINSLTRKLKLVDGKPPEAKWIIQHLQGDEYAVRSKASDVDLYYGNTAGAWGGADYPPYPVLAPTKCNPPTKPPGMPQKYWDQLTRYPLIECGNPRFTKTWIMRKTA